MCIKHKFIVNIKKSYSSYVYCVSIYMMHAWIVGVAPNQNRQVFFPFSFHIYCIWNYRYYNLKIMFHISFLYGNFLWVFVISLPKRIFYFCLRINVAETKNFHHVQIQFILFQLVTKQKRKFLSSINFFEFLSRECSRGSSGKW